MSTSKSSNAEEGTSLDLCVKNGQCPTVRKLSDEVLLEIFTWFRCLDDLYEMDAWHALVHVCQRWRHLVFSSPRRLNLRLGYTPGRSVRKMLRIWPALPVSIWNYRVYDMEDVDNIVAALEHGERVCEITLGDLSSSKLEALASAMLKPFPALEYLVIEPLADESVPLIPDSFLGGSAPLLKYLSLDGIPFPALPKLLLSARDLVHLSLTGIPRSGFISPEVIATCLSTMSRLKRLELEFRSPQSRPDEESRRLPLPRYELPALARLVFRGTCEYLEDLLTRIDVPLIHSLHITFTNRPFLFHISQLQRLIERTEKFQSLSHASIDFRLHYVSVRLHARTRTSDSARLSFEVLCNDLYPQLRGLAQAGRSQFLPLFNIESLEISSECHIKQSHHENSKEDNPWPKVLRPFSAVKNLYLSKNVVTPVAFALKEVAEERMTKVLPVIQNLSIGGSSHSRPVEKAIEEFITERGLSNDPVKTYSQVNADDRGIFSAFHQ